MDWLTNWLAQNLPPDSGPVLQWAAANWDVTKVIILAVALIILIIYIITFRELFT